MPASLVFAARSRRNWIWNQPKQLVFKFVLLFGFCCWTSFAAKIIVRLISSATSTRSTHDPAQILDPVESDSTVLCSLQCVADPACDIAEYDGSLSMPSRFSNDTHGLDLQSTFISPSQRCALISGEQVDEGTTRTIQDISFRIDLVTPWYVGLTIDGTSVRLPLKLDVSDSGEFKTSANLVDDFSHSKH